MNESVKVIYKDLCEYYDMVKKDTHSDKWLILMAINKNKGLIIDDIANDYPNLDINKHTFKVAFKKLEREYDNENDPNCVHALGWKKVAIANAFGGYNSSSKKNEDKSDLEKEMDAYNLDEEEKELVRNGEYDPWDFEYPSDQEDMDDDDYYGEDDI